MASITGGTGADTLTGTAERDYFAAGAGNDTIDSGAGDDWIEGGSGADTFVFNPGCGWDCVGDFRTAEGDRLDLRGWSAIRSLADLTVQADGNDTILLFGPTDGVRLMGVSPGSLTAASFLFAGDAGDGGGSPGGAAGEPAGGGGPAGLTLTGSGERDFLIGGAGNDTITAGAGLDYMEGGAGTDTFVCKPGDSWDYIQDFQAGAGGDVLDLTAWSNLRSIADLTITSDGGGTSLMFGPADGMRLANVAGGALTAANFKFAAAPEPEPEPEPTREPYVLYPVRLADGTTRYEMRRLGEPDGAAVPAALPNAPDLSGKKIVYAGGDALYITQASYLESDGLWRIDLADPGAAPVKVAEGSIYTAFESDGALYVAKYYESNLFRIDLEHPEAGEVEIGPLRSGMYYADAAVVGDTLYTSRYGGSFYYTTPFLDDRVGNELAAFDLNNLTGDLPAVVADLLPGQGPTVGGKQGNTWRVAASSSPHSFASDGGQVYFAASAAWDSPIQHLYRLDTTQDGAQPVKVGDGTALGLKNIWHVTAAGGDLFFAAQTDATGIELFHLDLDTPGAAPQLVADLAPGAANAIPSSLTVHDDRLYFAAETGDGQRSLFHVPLHAEGTITPVFDQTLGASWSDSLTTYNNNRVPGGDRPFLLVDL
ncbi:hypothetical protein [Azospirillum sp.]|uniref:hypothetical protein n=1 Tax=Azospirillum sp. TaxID=34012 RepID=UPI003D708DB2